MLSFDSILEKYENNLWNYHLKVPNHIIEKIKKERMGRFMCSLNKGSGFHASLMPAGNGIYFIKINKELRQEHKIELGDVVTVSIEKDKSKYGMPLPEEMEELFLHDPEGDHLFHQLTPGKQRSLLYLVVKIKSKEKRIEKSFIILEHLKEQKGSLDFKILNQDFKDKKGII